VQRATRFLAVSTGRIERDTTVFENDSLGGKLVYTSFETVLKPRFAH
jgi:hypothetical protein